MKTVSPRPRLTTTALLAALLAVFAVTSGGAQSRTLITLNDLTWKGLYQVPESGDFTFGGAGTPSYSSGALAVRYVNGQRRYLIPTFTRADPSTGQQWGDLVEYRDPAEALYTGDNPPAAPALVETRRWANWTSYATTPNWQDRFNGARIGGLYWDEAKGVLWYQLYCYYYGRNTPFLAATKLLDTVTSGNYRAVGTKSGPWWYRLNDPNDQTFLHWKTVNFWMTRIPASAQPDLGGRKFIVGASVGSIAGAGNLGPGFHAIPDLPPLTDPPNSVIPNGLHLADYTYAGPQRPPNAHRDTNYSFRSGPAEIEGGVALDSPGTGLFPPSSGHGFWQMNLDQVNSFCWVETETRQGIIMFGRAAHGDTWYGWNPRWQTPRNPHDPPDSSDPTRSSDPPDGNGYGASVWSGAVYVFDPVQVREVGRGVRSPYSDGINPILLGDWHVQWPNIPLNKDNLGGTGISKPISQSISNTCYWDATASQLIWVQPMSTDSSARPTISVFAVRGGLAAPASLRIDESTVAARVRVQAPTRLP